MPAERDRPDLDGLGDRGDGGGGAVLTDRNLGRELLALRRLRAEHPERTRLSSRVGCPSRLVKPAVCTDHRPDNDSAGHRPTVSVYRFKRDRCGEGAARCAYENGIERAQPSTDKRDTRPDRVSEPPDETHRGRGQTRPVQNTHE